MNIANLNGENYEFLDREGEEITLICNSWVQGFAQEIIDGMYLYARHINRNEAHSIASVSITASLTPEGEQYPVTVADTNRGDIIIPESERFYKATGQNLFNTYIPLEEVKEKFPKLVFRKVRKNLFDGSVSSVPVQVYEAEENCLKFTRISGIKTLLNCRCCGISFPFDNSRVIFGESFDTSCPSCGAEISGKRS